MTKKYWSVLCIVILFICLAAACSKLEPVGPEEEKSLDGPLDGLSYEQLARHAAGDEIFDDRVFTAATGLGPVFVAASCGSCHAEDGKGHPFTTLIRFGRTDSLTGNNTAPGGPQLQNRAIQGYLPEQLPPGQPHASFTPPIVTGLGFLELVSDNDILAMAADNANNSDGVRGRPNWNYIPAYISPKQDARDQNGRYICRFGKKASVYNLLHQTISALNQDIGITSTFNSTDVYSGHIIDPEIDNQSVENLVFYLQTLKVPPRRGAGDLQVEKGGRLFISTGCETCHRQTLKTGYSPVASLSYQEFHPFTDLLLHDMGPGLDDGYTEGTATTPEWRTAPLWGLGLAPRSQGGGYYLLHDGRARSIEEAIVLHGGEASVSKKKFEQLSPDDKKALIKFLESL